MVNEALWSVFRSAIVQIYSPNYGPYVVGPRSVLRENRDVSTDRNCWIITAENPDGIDASDESNTAASRALERDLEGHGWSVQHARGGDVSWTHTERSFAVTGPTEEQAIALGQKYGQLAIFGWDHAWWTLISCVDDRREQMLWGSIHLPVARLSERLHR